MKFSALLRTFYTFLIALACTATVKAEIGFDAASSSAAEGVVSLSWNHTTGPVAEGILIVGVTCNADKTVNNVTYNGKTLTRLSSIVNQVRVELWYQLLPDAGEHTITIELSGTAHIGGTARTFGGANQEMPFGPAVTNTGSGTLVSADVTSANGEVVIDVAGSAAASFAAPGAEQVQRDSALTSLVKQSVSSKAGETSVTMSWSLEAEDSWAVVAVPLVTYVGLPVSLLSFEAECRGSAMQVSWNTGAEVNNDFFTLEKASDGIRFETIATIHGAGNSSVPTYYSITDAEPLEGTAYYRLKQTDFNGREKYFPVIMGKKCQEKDFAFEVSSQSDPVRGEARINCILPGNGPVEIAVYSLSGAQVMKKYLGSVGAGEHEIKIGQNDFTGPSGMYLVAVTFGGQTKTCKVVL